MLSLWFKLNLLFDLDINLLLKVIQIIDYGFMAQT